MNNAVMYRGWSHQALLGVCAVMLGASLGASVAGGVARAETADRTPSGKSTSAKSPISKAHPAKPDDAEDTKDAKPVAPEEESEHLVKAGETLDGIAKRAHVPRVLIIEANHLAPPYAVHAGQRLALPRTRHHVVKSGETGFDIAYRYGVPFSAIAVANGLSNDAKVKQGQTLLIPTVLKSAPKPDGGESPKKDKAAASEKLAEKPGKLAKADTPTPTAATTDEDAAPPRLFWPVEGKVRRGFTAREKGDATGDYHDGIDIPATAGTATRAVASGTVLFAGKEPQSFGNLVVIDHGGGWQSAYGFLGKATVAKGDTVTAHERVGLVGHSGKATRDELHFELRRANKPVDPVAFLPKVKKRLAKEDEDKPAPKGKPAAKSKAKKQD